jgi:hypothetical protein
VEENKVVSNVYQKDQKIDYKWEIMNKVSSMSFLRFDYVIQLCAEGIPVQIFSYEEKIKLWKSEKNKIILDKFDCEKITGITPHRHIFLGKNKRKFILDLIYYYPEANKIIGTITPINPKTDPIFRIEEKEGYPFMVLSTRLIWKYYEKQQGQEYLKGTWDWFIPKE